MEQLGRNGQFKIQQMAFMILAVFIFFALVGVFFMNFKMGDIRSEAQNALKEQAITSVRVISNMPEFSCLDTGDYCLDEDKLKVMTGNLSKSYEGFWPIASIKVYKIYPRPEKVIECPALNCNYFDIYSSGQKNLREYSSYVSICKRVNDDGNYYDKCEIGKILVGVQDVKI